jgi:hypothetical protein
MSNLGASGHCFGCVSTLQVSILSPINVFQYNWYSKLAKMKYNFLCFDPCQYLPDLSPQLIIITSFTIATFPVAFALPS